MLLQKICILATPPPERDVVVVLVDEPKLVILKIIINNSEFFEKVIYAIFQIFDSYIEHRQSTGIIIHATRPMDKIRRKPASIR